MKEKIMFTKQIGNLTTSLLYKGSTILIEADDSKTISEMVKTKISNYEMLVYGLYKDQLYKDLKNFKLPLFELVPTRLVKFKLNEPMKQGAVLLNRGKAIQSLPLGTTLETAIESIITENHLDKLFCNKDRLEFDLRMYKMGYGEFKTTDIERYVIDNKGEVKKADGVEDENFIN